jgi:hypothetical protein
MQGTLLPVATAVPDFASLHPGHGGSLRRPRDLIYFLYTSAAFAFATSSGGLE